MMTATQTPTPCLDRLHAALLDLEQARLVLGDAQEEGDEDAAEELEELIARMEVALDATRAALAASDEPRTYVVSDGAGRWEIQCQPANLAAEVRGSIDWLDASSTTTWVHVQVRGEDGSDVPLSIEIEPEEPECLDGEVHEWRSPYAIVGGLVSNAGVWGHGGGVIINECCVHCGCRKQIDTWAQDRETGEQGLTSVAYEPGHYAEALAEFAERNADDE